MNISCNVIRDILPLYAEDMVCEETKALVDEHLRGCDECTRELEKLKKQEAIPVSADTAPMEHIRKTIRKRQILTTVCVLMTILSLVWSWIAYWDAPIYLTAEQAIDGIELREDGGLYVDFGNGYNGWGGYENGKAEMVIYAVSTREGWRKGQKEDREFQTMTREEQEAFLKNRHRISELTQNYYDLFNQVEAFYFFQNEKGQVRYDLQPDPDKVWQPREFSGDVQEKLTRTEPNLDLWYAGPDGKHETLLWEGGDGVFEGEEEDRPLSCQMVLLTFLFGLGITVITAAAAFLLRKSKWRYLPLAFTAYGGSLMVFALIVSGGTMTGLMGSGLPGWNEHFISTTLILAATALLWFYRHDLNKKETF